jgi:large subunit ribosomal protein L24
MRKIRKGDLVAVITGRDKGKRGIVLSRVENDYFLVEGVNLFKKAVKPNPAKGIPGGFVYKNLPIHSSNVAMINPTTGMIDRVGIKLLIDEKTNQLRRVRVFKSTNVEIKN